MSRQGGQDVVRLAISAVLLVAFMCAPGVARAQFTPTGSEERKSDPAINERTLRSGLVVSLAVGLGVSTASGYPNNSNQIGDESYYSASNVMGGSGGALFVGGALSDYLNFGFFLLSESFRSSSWDSKMSGGGLRVEAFPLVYLVPTLKNAGVFADFGIGATTLDVRTPGYPEAHGVQSIMAIGGMYEFTIFHLFSGHGVFGPTIEYDTVFSQSMTSGAGVLGARLAFYGSK
jgi:hypothetical protein